MRSLYFKVLVPLVVVIAAATAVFTAAGAVYESRVIDNIVAERTRSLTAMIRHDIVRAMRSGRAAELQWILNDLGSNPDIAGLRILATDGTVRRSTRPSEVKSILSDHAQQTNPRGDPVDFVLDGHSSHGHALHSVEPLLNRPECNACHGTEVTTIALLDLDIDVGRQRTGARTWWAFNATLAAVEVLALTALVFPVIGVLVLRPVRRFTDAMRDVQEGRFEPVIMPSRTTEFTSLREGFNAMVKRLKETAELEEQKRRLQLERAEQLAAVGELAAGLAHEIRSPLSAVKAAVEVLADEMAADDPRRAILTESASELARIGGVTRELLEYARPRRPAFMAFDLNEVIADLLLLNEARAAKQGAHINVTAAPEALVVEADRAMVRQVLVNLTLNALHAVAGIPNGRVEVSTHRDGPNVVCRVRDNGPGVPVAQGEAIFKPFITTKARGTGLGLAISRRLVEIQGGRLWLENAGHQGASFAFTVPAAGQVA